MMNCDRGFLHNFRIWTVPRVSVEDPRGARHWGASSCHTLVYGRTAWILDHDAVMRICGEAPGGGPHSLSRHQVPCSNTGSRHLGSSIRQSAEKPARAPSR